MKIISGYQLTVTEEQREETARLSGLVAREFESGLDSRIRIQGIVDGPRFVLFTYLALKRYAPQPMARQFLDGELTSDPKTQKMIGNAKSLFLLELVNAECVDA